MFKLAYQYYTCELLRGIVGAGLQRIILGKSIEEENLEGALQSDSVADHISH